MHMHDGTSEWLKMVTAFVFIGVAVWWLDGAIGGDYTVLVIFALVGVLLFAGGALFAHMNQKQTLDAITKFNANDAQIDKFRMGSFKALAQGESAMQRAAAQLTVIDAKRITRMADEKAKVMMDGAQRNAESVDSWAVEDEDANAFVTWE